MASLRSLRRVARLAHPLPNCVPSTSSQPSPLALLRRHKATQAAPLSTAAGGGTGGSQLPFYVNWIGSYLGSSLNRAQLDAFASQYLPAAASVAASEAAAAASSAASPSASSSSSPAAAAAAAAASNAAAAAEMASVQRERDAAVAKVTALEATSAELQSRVNVLEGKVADATSAGAAQLGLLRTRLKAAESDAADARVALNALKEQQSKTAADAAAAKTAAETTTTTTTQGRSEEEVERIVAAGSVVHSFSSLVLIA